MFDLEIVREKAKIMLDTGLSEKLTYHSYAHTIWVVESCLTIAANEGIKDATDLLLLETSAWFHDLGFVRTYLKHEEKSCEIATEILTQEGASVSEIKKVCDLIMSTRIPQTPCCHLGEILCDADLDYLGRDDFFPWSDKLRKEWYNFGMINSDDEFEERQQRFLNAHRYHTRDAQMRREPVKQLLIKELINKQNNKVSV